MTHWRERITQNRYFYHYMFWAIVLLSYVVDAAALRAFDPVLFFRTLVLKNGLLIAIVYFHLRILMPFFLKPKRYGVYVLGISITIVLGAWLSELTEHFSWKIVQTSGQISANSDYPQEVQQIEMEVIQQENIVGPGNNGFLLNILTVCRYLVISVLLQFIDDFFRQREELRETAYQKTMAELQILKAQINPHFLFNTLNNLYGLVLERSEKAAETLLKLADMMRYTLSEATAPSVLLKKDLENLQHYVDLERLRLTDTSRVLFDIEGKIGQQLIAPLLLLPLIENAFKYGLHQSTDKTVIEIRIQVYGASLELNTKNKLPLTHESSASLGLGLQNVQKRLELLYPARHQLIMDDTPPYFKVQLRLQLS